MLAQGRGEIGRTAGIVVETVGAADVPAEAAVVGVADAAGGTVEAAVDGMAVAMADTAVVAAGGTKNLSPQICTDFHGSDS